MANDQNKEGFTQSLPLRITRTQQGRVKGVAEDLGLSDQAAGRLLLMAGLAVYETGDMAAFLAAAKASGQAGSDAE